MDFKKGDKVIDANGIVGIVTDTYDLHNIKVSYLPNKDIIGGEGLYCVVEGCYNFDQLKVIP